MDSSLIGVRKGIIIDNIIKGGALPDLRMCGDKFKSREGIYSGYVESLETKVRRKKCVLGLYPT